MMDGLNHGVWYLARICYPSLSLCLITIVLVGDYLPAGPPVVLYFKVLTGDQWFILVVAELPPSPNINLTTLDANSTTTSLHKVRTTIPVTAEYGRLWEMLPVEPFSPGDSRCHGCKTNPQIPLKQKGGRPICETRMTVSPERIGILLHRERLETSKELRE